MQISGSRVRRERNCFCTDRRICVRRCSVTTNLRTQSGYRCRRRWGTEISKAVGRLICCYNSNHTLLAQDLALNFCMETIHQAEPIIKKLALHELIDPRIGQSYDTYELYLLAKAAYSCVQRSPEMRPSMGEVIRSFSLNLN